MNIKFLFLVFIGGGLGSVFRFLCSVWLQKISFFPFGTLFVNVFGALLMGVSLCFLLEKNMSSDWKIFFMTGFLGGFTTFSSFGMEVFLMFKEGTLNKALVYIFVSNFLALLCVYFGFVLAKKFVN